MNPDGGLCSIRTKKSYEQILWRSWRSWASLAACGLSGLSVYSGQRHGRGISDLQYDSKSSVARPYVRIDPFTPRKCVELVLRPTMHATNVHMVYSPPRTGSWAKKSGGAASPAGPAVLSSLRPWGTILRLFLSAGVPAGPG